MGGLKALLRYSIVIIAMTGILLHYGAPTFAQHHYILPISYSWPSDKEKEKLELGEKLFHDPRFSKDNTLSCASCHSVQSGYGDAGDRRYSPPGVSGESVPINVPTFLNAAFQGVFFWDGRAHTLEEQMDGPIHNPHELGSSWEEILLKLQKDEAYQHMFKKVYGSAVTKQNVTDAIVQYEKWMVTPNAPFDCYLHGDESSIGEDAKEGYKLFVNYGCVSCHQGQNVGGNLYQRMGIIKDYFSSKEPRAIDYGRYNVTKNEEDKFVFRVPSLRNIAKTPPYFHDGSASTLEEAIRIMAFYQLGRQLDPKEVRQIKAFLETLTGEVRHVSKKETLP